jgi:hypothetical protein
VCVVQGNDLQELYCGLVGPWGSTKIFSTRNISAPHPESGERFAKLTIFATLDDNELRQVTMSHK